MKHASGYHRLKAKYELLKKDRDSLYSQYVNAKTEETILISEKQSIIENHKNVIQSYSKRFYELKDINKRHSKLIKVLAFGWVVFIVAFLIFLFTF